MKITKTGKDLLEKAQSKNVISMVRPPVETIPSEASVLYLLTWLDWKSFSEKHKVQYQGIKDFSTARIAEVSPSLDLGSKNKITYVLADGVLERYNFRHQRIGCYQLEFIEE
jgi:hypothetical protein